MRYPSLWLFAAVLVGIGWARYVGGEPHGAAVGAGVCLIGAARGLWTGRGAAVLALGAFCCLAAWQAQRLPSKPVSIVTCGDATQQWRVSVDSALQRMPRGARRGVVRLLAERCDGVWLPRVGRVSARLRGGGALGRGDVVQLRLVPKPLGPPQNPGERSIASLVRHRQLDGYGAVGHGYVVVRRSVGLLARVDRLRDRVGQLLEQRLPGPQAAFAKALAMGDRGAISIEARQRWAEAGVAHLLAISGLHVGIVASFIYFLVYGVLVRLPSFAERYSASRIASALTALFAIAFCTWVGAPPSTLRATVMTCAYLVGRIVGRPAAGINSIGLAGVAISLWHPAAVEDVGFILSFSAALSLLVIPRLRRAGHFRGLATAAAASLLVTFVTAPAAAHFFGYVTPWAPLVNLIAIPASWLLVVSTLGLGLLASVAPAMSEDVAFGVAALLRAADAGVRYVADLPYAVVPISLGSGWLLMSWTIGAAGVLIGLAFRRIRLTCAAIVCAVIIPWLGPAMVVSEEAAMEVYFPYVGQGDAAIIRLPSGQTMLIDAGGTVGGYGRDPGYAVLSPVLRQMGIRHIDLAVITHPHPDHYNGFVYLTRLFAVGELWYNGQGADHPALQEILHNVRAQGGQVVVTDALAERVNRGGVEIVIVHPRPPPQSSMSYFPELGVNDNSVVLHMRHGDNSILFSGDIEEMAEDLLLPRMPRADVLKVPHHGSKTSSSQALLDVVKPRIAVVSCGVENRFGFPHQEVQARYADAGIELLRTDTMGMVTLKSDGRSWSTSQFRSGQNRLQN